MSIEKEPSFTVEVGGNKYELSQTKTSLYRHLGAQAVDHFFLRHGEPADGVQTGTRFFRELFEGDSFDSTSGFMVNNGYEAYLNIIEPSPDDMDAYIRFSTKNEDSTPDWLPQV